MDEKKVVDPEMSAAAKTRAAKAPRDAKGHFVATTNAQEQQLLDAQKAITELEASLDDAHLYNQDMKRKVAETQEHLLAINSAMGQSICSYKEMATRARHLRGVEEKLFAVCTALNLPFESSTLSADDFNSNLRDAYDAAMRADAETLYAPVVAERDRLKATLETERADAEVKITRANNHAKISQVVFFVFIVIGIVMLLLRGAK